MFDYGSYSGEVINSRDVVGVTASNYVTQQTIQSIKQSALPPALSTEDKGSGSRPLHLSRPCEKSLKRNV